MHARLSLSFALGSLSIPCRILVARDHIEFVNFFTQKTARIGVSNPEIGNLLLICKLFLLGERSNHVHVY